jgi:putative transposase
MGSASVDQDWSKLRKWLIKKRLEGKSVTAICAEAQVDRKMFYRWWSRYQAQGWKGLEEKARGRPVGPGIDDSLKQKVIKLRKRYEWGHNKIAGCLNRKGFSIDHNQAYHIICDAGLNHPISEPRKTWGTKRFQREHNNSLWQADFKLCNDDFWMISFQDDHSRFITGSVKIYSPTGENAILLLEKAVKRYGVPEQILTDQGTQFKPAREKHPSLIGTAVSWGLSISLRAFAGLPPVARLKPSIKPTKQSLTCSRSTGASYATTTTPDLTKG